MGCRFCSNGSSVSTCDSVQERKTRKKKQQPPSSAAPDLRRFRYEELETATSGFSPTSLLGKGSHGSVYKALIDNGKLPVAVKLSSSSSSSSFSAHSLLDQDHPGDNELRILSAIRHPRLVNLIGFTTAASAAGKKDDHDEECDKKKLIVVEFMPNGTLYDHLHCQARPLGWARRLRLALQTARAVDALHASDPPVIHRDIKSSNVLIDARFNARLGDFGLALRGHAEDVRLRATPPAGTLGYLDPAYLTPQNLSTKSDVFSFGILLLEIISGRHAIDVNYSPPSIVDWALPLIGRGEFEAVMDRRIGAPRDAWVGRRLVELAEECVQGGAEKRPAMEEVVRRLKEVKRRLPVPIWSGLAKRVAVVGSKKVSNVNSSTATDSCEKRRSSTGHGEEISGNRILGEMQI